MTQTIRHITSSTTCDIYYHPNNPNPPKGYKNEQCRYKYTVDILEIKEILLQNYIDVTKFNFVTDIKKIQGDDWLEWLLSEWIKGSRYYTASDSDLYFAKTKKEAIDYFNNFYC